MSQLQCQIGEQNMRLLTLILISCFAIQGCKTRSFGTPTAASQENSATPYNQLVQYIDSNESLDVDGVLDLYSKLSSSDLRRFLTEYPKSNAVIQGAKDLSVEELTKSYNAAGNDGKAARRQFNSTRAKFLASLFNPFVVEVANLSVDRAALQSFVTSARSHIESIDIKNRFILKIPESLISTPGVGNGVRDGFYGRSLAEAIVLTNFYYAGELERLMAPRKQKLKHIGDLFSETSRHSRIHSLTLQTRPDSSLLEGIFTIGQSLEVLTRNEVKTSDGATTGLRIPELLREISESNVIVRLAAKMRFGVLAHATAIRSEQSAVRIGPSKFVWPEYIDELNQKKQAEVDRSGGNHGTEVGCPVAMISRSISTLISGRSSDSDGSRSSPLTALVDRYIETLIHIHTQLERDQMK
jgi:hypothetical protein